jgi:hypothetical protein
MAVNKTKIIDDVEFSVAPFMAIEALRLKAYLFRTFGPALGQMIGLLKNVLTDNGNIAGNMQIDGSALAGAIETLMGQLDETTFVNLIKRMFQSLVAKGKDKSGKGFARQFDEKNFDNSFNFVFQGRIFSIYPVLILVLEANYPDFFEKTVRSIGRLTKGIASSEPGDGTETEKSSNSETSEN